jgi:hypothetical protein
MGFRSEEYFGEKNSLVQVVCQNCKALGMLSSSGCFPSGWRAPGRHDRPRVTSKPEVAAKVTDR